MNARTRFTGLIVLSIAVTLTAAQAPVPTAEQVPTFKVEVNYVEVDVVVTDQQGSFVRNLTRDDFQLFEDGRPQTISTFAIVDIPVERAERPLFAAQPIESDVTTNARPFDGRAYVMVIDDLHTLFGRAVRVRRAAREFIERNLGANDLMAVVHTAGPADASQEFTSKKRLLLAAVDKTQGRNLRSATPGRTEQRDVTMDDRQRNDPDDAERGFNARSTLLTLKNVADWFGGVRGRKKTILFVSEGIDYDINDVFNNQSASMILDATRDAIASATKSNVSIYGIDPRGLTPLAEESIEAQGYPDDTAAGIGAAAWLNEVRLSQDSLRVLSDETGGFAAVNRNDFATAYTRIVKDNSSYYVMAYYPPTDKRDGKFHTIDVRVTRPGLTVHARKGYASPKGKPAAAPATAAGGASAAVREALNSPIPVNGLTLHVFAAPFKGTGGNASVLFGTELRGQDLKLGPDGKVDLWYSATDASGKAWGVNTATLTLNLKPETRALVLQTGLRLLNRLDLPPGRYQLHVAANDGEGGKVGSVICDLDVPDFTKGPLLMSGLVLTSLVGSQKPTAQADDQLKSVLPGPPVALREFPQNDEIALFAEVYDNEAGSPHKVDVVATVTSDAGKVLYKSEEERSSSELLGKRGGYGYIARIPMADLPPGPYVLKVEARSRLGQGPTVSRELQFSVGGVEPPSTR